MYSMIKIILLTLLSTQVVAQFSFHQQTLIHDLQVLSADSLEGRKTGTAGNRKARKYILDRLEKIDADPFIPKYLQPFLIPEKIEGINILSVIPGKRKETIVISAHYDHLGIRNNIIYNGADDNSSGVATLLAMMQYFKKNIPEHRLIFAFFDAEELGLKGSAYFVNSLDLQKENIILNVNLDMVSRSDKNELYVCGSYHNPQLKNYIEKTKVLPGIKLLFGHDDPATNRNDWTNQSDHYSFHQKNIAFLYFGVEDHADYHKPGDDFEKVDVAFYAKSTETILQAVNMLDKSLQ